MHDTSPATVEVLGMDRLHGRGRLLGLATVELVLDGVQVVLQGVQVVRRPDGLAEVRMPEARHSTGEWVPAVVLPEELEQAIARQVMAEFAPAAVLMPLMACTALPG